MSKTTIIMTGGALLLVVCVVVCYFFFLACVHDSKGVDYDITGKTIDSDTLDKFYSDIKKTIKKELESGRISEKQAAVSLRLLDPTKRKRGPGEIEVDPVSWTGV